MKSKKYEKSFFIYFLLFGVLVEAITITVIFAYNYFDIQKQVHEKYQLEKVEKVDILKTIVNQTKSSINAVVDNKIFTNYLKDETTQNAQIMKDLFSFVMSENRFYLQVRYIDEFGKEKIRVDRKKGSHEAIDDKNLQNKSNRYYFKEIMGGKKEEFWYSSIDLNMEQGTIQIPHNPTFRIGKKLVVDGKQRGIVIINLSMKNILSRVINSWNFHIFLIDKEGNYIFSQKKSWSKDLEKKDNFFEDENIKKEKINTKGFEREGLFMVNLSKIFQSKQGVYLAFKNRGFMIDTIVENNIYATIVVMILVLFISIPIAFIISKIPTRLYTKLMDSFAKIKEFSKIIDKYVMSLSVDNEGNIKDTSTAFVQKGEYNKHEVIGKKYEDIILHSDEEQDKNRVLENGEMLAKGKNGSHFWVEQTVSPLECKRGNKIGYASILFDISEKKEIKKQALTDYLTSLPNRRNLDEALKREVELSRRYDTTFSIFLIDVDYFKKVNDTYGHTFGDKVLISLGKIFSDHLRNTDNVGRYGGEEFLVILPYTELEGAIITAENFRQAIRDHTFEGKCKITASFGVAQFGEDDDSDSIIQRADEALYMSKNGGRDRVSYL